MNIEKDYTQENISKWILEFGDQTMDCQRKFLGQAEYAQENDLHRNVDTFDLAVMLWKRSQKS